MVDEVGLRTIRGKHYTRVRIGKGRRVDGIAIALADEDEARERARRIKIMARGLVDAGRWFDVEQLARALGAAKTEREVRVIETAAHRLAASGSGLALDGDTFEAFAARWTRGDLHRAHPDHVPLKQTSGDIGILSKYVNPLVGHLPLKSFQLEHADSVMRALPTTIGPARRRHVAQVIHRVLALAVFPAKIIKASPIPKGWLPKLGKGKALTYLYPDEDRQLLASADVDLGYRVLYGFLTREGMRVSEALLLDWTDIDLRRGGVNLDENKTDDPRAWALDPGVVEVLAWWKGLVGGKGPFQHLSAHHIADRLRDDLRAAGIDRDALFRRSEKRRPIRIHDLRATFVTVSLANGKTEAWVQDRTGHRSTLMIAKYRRAARTMAELGLGTLAPLAEAIPEVRGGEQVGIATSGSGDKSRATSPRKTKAGSPSRTRTGTTRRSRDFKAAAAGAMKQKSRRNAGSRTDSKALAKPVPQGDPHPTQARPTWRDLADSFDGFVASEAGLAPPRSRKG